MKRDTRTRWIKAGTTIGVLALLASGIAGFGYAVHSSPETLVAGPGQDPLVVETDSLIWADGYDVTRSFVGRVEARQESDLGFELAGMVLEILVDEGELVEAGAVIAVLDSERLNAQRQELVAAQSEAQARLELAELTLNRITQALELNATSQQEFDDADKSRSAAQAVLDRADAAIASIDVDIEKTRLRSPFDAVVSHRHLDAGRVVQPGVPVLRLLERDRPQARIGVAGNSVSEIATGQSVVVQVGEREVQGTVTSILPTRDQRGRAIDVIVELDAQLNGLRQGDLARLSVTCRVDSRGFWVPMQALTEGTRGLWSLYTLGRTERDTYEVRILQAEVELMHSEEDRAYVRGALQEDVRYVTRGLQRIAPGMVVRDQSTLLGLASSDRSMP